MSTMKNPTKVITDEVRFSYVHIDKPNSVNGGTPKKGDTVTVTGVVTNHEGKVQFSSGCKLDKVVAGTRVPATGDVSILIPAAAMLVSGMGTVALVIKKKEF